MTLAEKYEHLYDEAIPADFGREILRLIAKHADEVGDFVESHWQLPEAHDLLGHVSRAYVQQDLRSVASRWAPQIEGTFERTEKGGSHYTVVTAGRLVITASCIESPLAMPRAAEFRRRNAEASQLNWLQPDTGLSDSDLVYGILVYGIVCRKMTFASVAFPDRSCTAWLHKVDLRRKYPDTWNEIYPQTKQPTGPDPRMLPQDEKA